jgi:hypothetical protein
MGTAIGKATGGAQETPLKSIRHAAMQRILIFKP